MEDKLVLLDFSKKRPKKEQSSRSALVETLKTCRLATKKDQPSARPKGAKLSIRVCRDIEDVSPHNQKGPALRQAKRSRALDPRLSRH
jgi:hypothetical protein